MGAQPGGRWPRGDALTFFATPAALRAWLVEHHSDTSELWIGFYKKGAARVAMTYPEAVDEALCFGWIDGQKKAHDTVSYKLRFTPRKANSVWSKVNVGHAERLVREGRMTDAGLAAITTAKANGRWEAAYAGSRAITVPDDLQAWLDNHPDQAAFFASISAANRYAFLYRLATAVKPETRAKRFQVIVGMLTAGQVFHPKG